MPLFRDVRGNLDINDLTRPAIRCGSTDVKATDTTKTVAFGTPMPDVKYEVLLTASGLIGTMNVSVKTVTGFTLTLKLNQAGTVSYLAVGHA